MESSDRQGNTPYRPAVYKPEEPKRPKAGIIIAILVIVAIVLIVLFVFPGFLKGCSSNAGNQAAPAQGSSATATSPDTSTSTVKFDAEKAEKAAYDAAVEAGKQVFTGTVRTTTVGDRAAEISEDLASNFTTTAGNKLVLLELEGSPTIEARAADGASLTTQSDGKSIRLDDSYSSFDGKKITVAVHAADMKFPDEISGELYTVSAETVAVIAPLTEKTAESAIKAAGTIAKSTSNNISSIENAQKAKEEAEAEAQHQAEIEAQWQAEQEAQWQAEQEAQQAAEQAAQQNDYYVIPDSNARYLSRSELEGYSTYDLYLARNEIYARNGRMFDNQDLRDYFGSQAWYSGSIAPGDFDTNWMSDVERENAILIRQVEESRNSPYL